MNQSGYGSYLFPEITSRQWQKKVLLQCRFCPPTRFLFLFEDSDRYVEQVWVDRHLILANCLSKIKQAKVWSQETVVAC